MSNIKTIEDLIADLYAREMLAVYNVINDEARAYRVAAKKSEELKANIELANDIVNITIDRSIKEFMRRYEYYLNNKMTQAGEYMTGYCKGKSDAFYEAAKELEGKI